MFYATKGIASYTAQAQATQLHTPTQASTYKFTPYVKYVYAYARLRCMGLTLHTPVPNAMYVKTPLNRLAQYL